MWRVTFVRWVGAVLARMRHKQSLVQKNKAVVVQMRLNTMYGRHFASRHTYDHVSSQVYISCHTSYIPCIDGAKQALPIAKQIQAGTSNKQR